MATSATLTSDNAAIVTASLTSFLLRWSWSGCSARRLPSCASAARTSPIVCGNSTCTGWASSASPRCRCTGRTPAVACRRSSHGCHQAGPVTEHAAERMCLNQVQEAGAQQLRGNPRPPGNIREPAQGADPGAGDVGPLPAEGRRRIVDIAGHERGADAGFAARPRAASMTGTEKSRPLARAPRPAHDRVSRPI